MEHVVLKNHLIQIIHKLTMHDNTIHSVRHVRVVPEAHGWFTNTAVSLIREKHKLLF